MVFIYKSQYYSIHRQSLVKETLKKPHLKTSNMLADDLHEIQPILVRTYLR